MTRIDELSPDRRAVLSLILRRGRTYAQIATALQIDEDTVRDHAHGALCEIAGEAADGLNDSEREQIGDYLLAQQSATERLVTYDELEGSAAARAFARALAGELAPLAANGLPEIPGDADAAARSAPGARKPGSARARRARPAQKAKAPAAERRVPASLAEGDEEARMADEAPREPAAEAQERRRSGPAAGPPRVRRPQRPVTMPSLPSARSSRVGGAILLGVIVIGVVLAIVLSGGGGGSSSAKSGATHAATGGTGATGAGGAGQVQLSKQIKLTPPAGGSALGAAAVLSQNGRYVIALAAEHLPPTQGFFYAAWLYNSPRQAYALGKAPSVSSDGKLKPVAQALPESAGQYHQLIVTKETSEHPTQPGETVLTGAFSLH
jgi:Sigma-70, region 4